MKSARQEMYFEAISSKNGHPPIKKARVHYQFIVKGNRRHDLDNLLACCKPYLDGLVDAHVIVADDIKHLEIGSVRAEYGNRDETIISVEAIK